MRFRDCAISPIESHQSKSQMGRLPGARSACMPEPDEAVYAVSQCGNFGLCGCTQGVQRAFRTKPKSKEVTCCNLCADIRYAVMYERLVLHSKKLRFGYVRIQRPFHKIPRFPPRTSRPLCAFVPDAYVVHLMAHIMLSLIWSRNSEDVINRHKFLSTHNYSSLCSVGLTSFSSALSNAWRSFSPNSVLTGLYEWLHISLILLESLSTFRTSFNRLFEQFGKHS